MPNFTLHSTRLAWTNNVSIKVRIDTVFQTGGWHGMRTFANYYNKQINDLEMFSKSIVMW